MYPDTQGTFCVTAVYGSREHKSEIVCLTPCLAINKGDGRDAVSMKLCGDEEKLRHATTNYVSLLG